MSSTPEIPAVSPLSSPELETLARLARATANGRWLTAAQLRYFNASTAEFIAACRPERILGLIEAAQQGAEDSARLDWLEAHDFSPTCWNVPTGLDAERWAAPMKPNNGWTISLGSGEDDDRRDPHGKTLRDAIDWAVKSAAPEERDDATAPQEG